MPEQNVWRRPSGKQVLSPHPPTGSRLRPSSASSYIRILNRFCSCSDPILLLADPVDVAGSVQDRGLGGTLLHGSIVSMSDTLSFFHNCVRLIFVIASDSCGIPCAFIHSYFPERRSDVLFFRSWKCQWPVPCFSLRRVMSCYVCVCVCVPNSLIAVGVRVLTFLPAENTQSKIMSFFGYVALLHWLISLIWISGSVFNKHRFGTVLSIIVWQTFLFRSLVIVIHFQPSRTYNEGERD